MNKEQRKFKKVIKARRRFEDYRKRAYDANHLPSRYETFEVPVKESLPLADGTQIVREIGTKTVVKRVKRFRKGLRFEFPLNRYGKRRGELI